MVELGAVKAMPLSDQVTAVSCGLCEGVALLDLDYQEDSSAQVDANFVMTGRGGIVEIQTTAEKEPFTKAQFGDLLALAEHGVSELAGLQRVALGL
jgi:ribonuclease PH